MLTNVLLTATGGTNVFKSAAEPIVALVLMMRGPLIAIVASIGTIYCIFLGAKLAKAEETQEREKAKQALKNAIVGFVLIFVLIVAISVMVDPLTKWMDSYVKSTNFSNLTNGSK